MTEKQKKLSIQTNKLQLSFWGKVSHFNIVIFLSILPLSYIFFHIRASLKGIPNSINGGDIFFVLIPALLAVVFYKLQSGRLKFKEVHTTLSRQELAGIIEKVGMELKWVPKEINDSIFIAKTHPSFFSGSWGEQITILFDTNRILINSICDPDKKSSVTSAGRNKINVNKLIEAIQYNRG